MNLATARLPVRSAALPEVATVASPVIVPAACVPVWLARALRFASVSFAVAEVAIPDSFISCAVVNAAVVFVRTVAVG